MSCQTDTAGKPIVHAGVSTVTDVYQPNKLIEVQEIMPVYNPTFTLKITSRFCCLFCLNADNVKNNNWLYCPYCGREIDA